MERELIGKCIDYTHDGMGVIKHNGIPIFVNDVLVGEEVKILITKVCKGYSLGKRLELLTVSPNRVKPICENYKFCGGCNIQHMSYEEQLRFKAKRVKDVLSRIGKVNIDTPNITGMDNPYRYRNKVQVPIGITYDNHIVAGFYHPKTHQVIDMDECFIEDKDADKLVVTIKKLLEKYNVEVCDSYHNSGVIKYVVIRKSKANNSLMVILVTRTDYFPKYKSFINELINENKNIKTVVQNINPSKGSVVLGLREKVLYGDGYIYDNIGDLTFKISAHSFYQINPIQTEILYKKAIDFASLTNSDYVLDAYCGVGTIGLSASKYCKEVIGVELVNQAIIDAKENARINNITNAKFYCEDAGKFMVKFAKSNKKIDVVFCDPPRDGCSLDFLNSLIKLRPSRIVYISCDPSSLARDLLTLTKYYNVDKVECVDMFPQSYHVETVVVLSLKK